MSLYPFAYPLFRATNSNGDPLAGGKLYSYVAGTSTPLTTYSDAALTVPNTNPILLDANGQAVLYLADGPYKFNLTDASDVQQSKWPIDDVPGPKYLDTALRSDLASQTTTKGSWLVGWISKLTGSVGRWLGDKLAEYPSVQDFGASPSASAAVNTAAFNAALAASPSIRIPSGTYNLNALNQITGSVCRIKGEGRSTKLVFNTTGVGIDVNLSGGSAQSRTLLIKDVTFGNLTNTPAALIKITYAVNPKLVRCYFSDLAATYCVDNVAGYGIAVQDCVFSDITGTGYIHRFNAGSVLNFIGNDFTRLSGSGCTFENTTSSPAGSAKFTACVFEQASGAGVEFNKGAGGGYVWNTHFDACHFESNTGYDIDIQPNGSVIQSYVNVTACTFAGTPQINLGSSGILTANSCQCSGGNVCTVTGSGSAAVRLMNCLNFVQSGTFYWQDDGAASASYTPIIGNVTTSAASGKYKVAGRVVTIQVSATVSAAPSGTITVSLPLAPSGNIANVSVGSVSATKAGTGYYIGSAWLDSGNSVIKIHSLTGGAEWNATLPFAWVNGDNFQLTAQYFV